jgi:hypothetical protein
MRKTLQRRCLRGCHWPVGSHRLWLAAGVRAMRNPSRLQWAMLPV